MYKSEKSPLFFSKVRRHPEEEVQKTGRSCFVNELGRTPKWIHHYVLKNGFMCFHTFRSLGVFSSPCGQHSNRATTARRADGRRRSASPQRMLCNLANAPCDAAFEMFIFKYILLSP